jgi:hypothetical protein
MACPSFNELRPRPLDSGNVNKDILAAARRLNESIALRRVEPLHVTLCHFLSLSPPVAKSNHYQENGAGQMSALPLACAVDNAELWRTSSARHIADRTKEISARANVKRPYPRTTPSWQSLPRLKRRAAAKSVGARWLETWHLAPTLGALSSRTRYCK